MKRDKPHKRYPPYYWWKFDGHSVVVKSDDKEFPLLGRFNFAPGEFADNAIDAANQLISDLNSGRITRKHAVNRYLIDR